MRQLAAHEVGHTLGLAHNYVASVANRASVMDYPSPRIKIVGNKALDLSDAYAKGIGECDKVAISMAYQQFPAENNSRLEVDKLVKEYLGNGLRFLTDQDARPEGGIHPKTHHWDNGEDAAIELKRIMQIRGIVLKGFGEKKIPLGSPFAALEEVFVPTYMMHRYQVAATAGVLSGVDYSYAVRGDGQIPIKLVAAPRQLSALEALLETLKPGNLAVEPELLRIIPPHPYGFARNSQEVLQDMADLFLIRWLRHQ
jgi:hypothetical protein